MAAQFTYDGFLFGHYDSRGGTTFIKAASELEALSRYAEDFCSGGEQLREDLLGPAVLDSDIDLLPHAGLDMDGVFQGHPGRVWLRVADGIDVPACLTIPGSPCFTFLFVNR